MSEVELPRSATEAKKSGAKYYFTGVSCVNGHVSVRYASAGNCVVCVKDRATKWKAANSSKVKKSAEGYRVRNADTINASIRKWAEENPDKVRASAKRWKDKNPEKARENSRKWVAANPGKARATSKNWIARNPDKVKASWGSRSAARRLGRYVKHDEFESLVLVEAHDLTARRFKSTGIRWHVDHCIPLRAKGVCGLHVACNLQVIPEKLNMWKLNRLVLTEPLEWLKFI